MANRQVFHRDSLRTNLRSGIRQCGKVWLITFLLLLCAPFIGREQPERILPPPPEPTPQKVESQSRIGVTLRSGDTLMSVLKRFRVEALSAHAMIEKVRPFVNPRKIRPGDNLHVVLNAEDQTVEAMEFVVEDNLVRVKATGEGWLAERREIPFVRESRVVRGAIESSLYETGIHAGLTAQHVMELAKIFEYDIDFFSDFQPKDAFQLIVEDITYEDGRRGAGRILAAQLAAGKDSFDAFYYVDKNGHGGYYNSNGEAQRRSFLRAPLSYARISSPFSRHRRHPIFRTVRPHLAIDYAAPSGTPVVAIGGGKVEFAGWRGGYGNVVDIRHAGNYVSRYAHFSRFAGRLRRGQSVDAGDVIGYVGQTGHATGPHLHFEFLRGTKKINFLDLRIPKTQHLDAGELPRFKQIRDQQLAQLRGGDQRVADNKTRHGL